MSSEQAAHNFANSVFLNAIKRGKKAKRQFLTKKQRENQVTKGKIAPETCQDEIKYKVQQNLCKNCARPALRTCYEDMGFKIFVT